MTATRDEQRMVGNTFDSMYSMMSGVPLTSACHLTAAGMTERKLGDGVRERGMEMLGDANQQDRRVERHQHKDPFVWGAPGLHRCPGLS